MLDGRVLGASQVEYKPFGKPPLKKKVGPSVVRKAHLSPGPRLLRDSELAG